jgi:anti-sigma B factor antagonist
VKIDTTNALTCWASHAGPGAVLQTLVARHVPRVDARRTVTRTESASIVISRRGSKPRDRDSEYTVVWVRGEHDIATRVSLVAAIARAAQRDEADLLVDLSEVTFMDASIIGALVGSRNRLRVRSQSLQLRAPSPPARRVLDLCGLTDLIIHPDAAEGMHPTGAAAALSTWVEAAPSTSRLTSDEPVPTPEPRPARLRATVAARRAERTATVEADRGGRDGRPR